MMQGTAHDLPTDYRRRKPHRNRIGLKVMRWHELANRHRRRALHMTLKMAYCGKGRGL